MHAKGHRIDANFALYFTPFDVTFAKGSPLLTSFFPGRSEKMGFWQGMRGAGRGAEASTAKLCEACDAGCDDQSGTIHSSRIFLLT
jgi:hypothetical protein